MIDETIKNIKKILWKILEGILTAKISEKKYFTRFWREYCKNSKYKEKNFVCVFVFPIYKRAKYKPGSNIS